MPSWRLHFPMTPFPLYLGLTMWQVIVQRLGGKGMCVTSRRGFWELLVPYPCFPLLPLNEDNSKARELWSLKVERTRSLNHYVEKTNSQPWNSSLVCFVEISSICVCFYQCEVLFVPAGSTNPNEPRLMRAKGTCVKTELRLWKLSLVLHARSVSFCIQCRKMNLSL